MITPSNYELWPHQGAAVDAIFDHYRDYTGNPLVCIATGGGKSYVIAAFVERLYRKRPSYRGLILTHVKELVAQNHEKIKILCPDIKSGIYSASLNKKEIGETLTVANIQSVYSNIGNLGYFHYVIIDECHLINEEDNSMYRKVFTYLKSMNPQLKIIGLTATPFRTGSGLLTHGENPLFERICYRKPYKELRDEGFLAPLIGIPKVGAEKFKDLRVISGDYVESEVESLMMSDDFTLKALREVIYYGQNRKSWLIFCASVNHAVYVSDTLKKLGVACEVVTSKTDSKVRDLTIKLAKNETIQAVSNCSVLTTGTDIPNIDLVVLLRATQSPVLLLQMVGRGTRRHPGKENCLILDYGGNLERFGPIDQIEDRIMASKPKQKANFSQPMYKTCPTCEEMSPIQTRNCPNCDYEFFNTSSPKHDEYASLSRVMSDEECWYEVEDVYYRLKGDPAFVTQIYDEKLQQQVPVKITPTKKLLVKYIVNHGMHTVSEYVPINDKTQRYFDVVAWLKERFVKSSLFDEPITAENIASGVITLKRPIRICTKIVNNKEKIIQYEFN